MLIYDLQAIHAVSHVLLIAHRLRVVQFLYKAYGVMQKVVRRGRLRSFQAYIFYGHVAKSDCHYDIIKGK